MSLDLDNLELEPQLSAEDFALELDPEPSRPSVEDAVAAVLAPSQEPTPAALMQVLPADFPLPTLIRFVPDPALRIAADEAAKYALSLEVREAEGVQRADAALVTIRTSIKAIEASFKEPTEIANGLHKQLTSTRAEWCAAARGALDTVGRRMALEQRRLQAVEDERRRAAQAEEDRRERERRRQEAEAAAKAAVPAPVVEQLRQQAETATAPPVPVTAPAPKLSGSSVVGTWKARLRGASGDADPNPAVEEMTPPQKAMVMTLLRAIVDAEHPLIGIQIDWSYWNKRAKADKSTLDAPGIEAFEDLGVRGKASRK